MSASSNAISRGATGAATGLATFAATVPTKMRVTRLKTVNWNDISHRYTGNNLSKRRAVPSLFCR